MQKCVIMIVGVLVLFANYAISRGKNVKVTG